MQTSFIRDANTENIYQKHAAAAADPAAAASDHPATTELQQVEVIKLPERIICWTVCYGIIKLRDRRGT